MVGCFRCDGSLPGPGSVRQSRPSVISAKKLIDNAVSLVAQVAVDEEATEDRGGSRSKVSTATR